MKFKALITTENNSQIICSLSRIDFNNYQLLKSCLPKEIKNEYTEEESLAIKEYNSFIDKLIVKNNGKLFKMDLKIKYYNTNNIF